MSELLKRCGKNLVWSSHYHGIMDILSKIWYQFSGECQSIKGSLRVAV